MVQEYYACVTRLTQEIGGRMRAGVEFEAVKAANLDFFLGRGSSIDTYGAHGDLLRTYRDYGVMDERFRRKKVKYLGTTGFEYVTVYFDDLRYTRYRYQSWYCLRLSDQDGELAGEVYEAARCEWGDTEDPVINSYAALEPMPAPQTRLFKQLYHPYIPEESRIESETVHLIQGDTRIRKIGFRYVGAALNVELTDIHRNPTAFFDLGTCVSGNINLLAQRPMAELSRAKIYERLENLSQDNPMTIFISHWHRDHCNALGNFVDNRGNFVGETIINHTEWFVPGDSRMAFHTMQAAIPASKFHVFPFGEDRQPMNVRGNTGIQVGKINCNADLHPHHHGLYVQVKIKNRLNVLLVGDTTYQGLPEAVRAGRYKILQVCHHGGDYYLPPADQNRETARKYIPRAADEARAIYSADGVHYGHPDPFYIEDHRSVGYSAANEEQLQQIALQDSNILEFL